jgi:hypothetical protein
MSRRLQSVMLMFGVLAATVTMALAGCGDDNNDTSSATAVTSEKTLEAAKTSAERAAMKSAQKAKDRYLPGPIELRTVCSEPIPPPQPNTAYQLKCHIEGFGTPPGGTGVRFMTSEDWLVPVDAQGNVGEATIDGTARIRAFRRLDDRLNCTNRKSRPEKCTKPAPNPGETPQTTPVPDQGVAPGSTQTTP